MAFTVETAIGLGVTAVILVFVGLNLSSKILAVLPPSCPNDGSDMQWYEDWTDSLKRGAAKAALLVGGVIAGQAVGGLAGSMGASAGTAFQAGRAPGAISNEISKDVGSRPGPSDITERKWQCLQCGYKIKCLPVIIRDEPIATIGTWMGCSGGILFVGTVIFGLMNFS